MAVMNLAQERVLKVEAVVLEHQEWGEADRLLTLFTREYGRMRAIAKGVRRIRSRKAGHLEPFTRVALVLARGRDLWIITQAETLEANLALHGDLEGIGYASYVAELLERLTYEEGPNPNLYRLLVDTLRRLDENLDPPALILRYFELHILDLAGFRPELTECVTCRRLIQPEDQYFSSSLGGVLCPTCGKVEPSARPVSMNALRYLRHLQRSTYPEARRARPNPAITTEMERILRDYLTYILEARLNSPEFIRQVRQNLSTTESSSRPPEENASATISDTVIDL
ncbi:DNA repair protein RecO [Thermanaerothrix sp. 4228-RoL]|uniref:DNA repair protein RecO n=1 Tax=Thermanaerothrix solaris TaxID=3058434 RepID=A0ABU3NS61_9CHLR|nr:DNA repair protein RecO [Thermanaerothrix sp. 4228-RoL]MDT8899043.1 DNA repair protein RecO [Thermanaerothrix sp. 4228-RoL]